MCSVRVGRVAGVGLVCALDIAGSVVLDWKRDRVWLVCGIIISGFVVLEWEE
jgi:hypothetical protein